MKQIIKAGTTGKSIAVFVQDSSVSTGVGLTGLTSASSGLKWYYFREEATASAAVSVVGQNLGTWTSGGFKEVDATNMPGIYEIGVPNAAIASVASSWVVMQLGGVTNMAPVNVEIELVQVDLQDAARFGLTSLPTITPGLAGGVVIGGTSGRVDVGFWQGTAVTAATAGIPDVNVKNYNNVTAQTDANSLPKVDVEDWKATAVLTPSTAGQPKVQTAVVDDKTGYALTQTFPTNFSSLAINGSGQVTVGTNADKTGYTLTQSFPSNFAALSITAGGLVTLAQAFPSNFSSLAITGGGAVTAGTVSDKTGYSLLAGQITVKKNTALTGFTFPMTNDTTHELVTGKTVSANRSIDGAAVSSCTNAVTEVGSGLYKITLSAADLNGNSITLLFSATGADTTVLTIVTQP